MIKADSISTKIAFILILIILPLNIISIVSARQAQNVILQQACHSVQSMMNSSMLYLDNQMSESNNYWFDLISNDANGITLIMQRGDTDYTNAKYFITRELATNTYLQNSVDVYFAYSPKLNDILIYKNSHQSFSRPDLEVILTADHFLDNYRYWTLFEFDGLQWMMHASKINGMYIGSMVCISNTLDNIKSNLVYTQTDVRAADSADTQEKDDTLYITAKSKYTDLYIHTALSRREIINTLPFFERAGVLITFLYLLLIPVLFICLNKILLKPLRKLDSAMAKLRAGNKEYRIGPHKYAREFVNINETFNTMADSIEQLKIDKYEAEIKQHKIELQNLQLQIRPHFLLNTFNLMFSLSQMDDRENLENTILYMADYFRYIFRSNQDMENFSIELGLIKSYLQVAALRYPNSFDITYDIDPNTMNVQIPPLLIHNYIENIFRHAMHDGMFIHITLKSRLENGIVQFMITDDGPGMDSALVAQINSETLEISDSHAHIGLTNSYQRIKHFLGAEATLRVISEPGEGCTVIITFPHSGSNRQEEEP